MSQKFLLVLVMSLSNLVVACGEKDTKPPRVIRTFPQNESQNVEPSFTEISVVFNTNFIYLGYTYKR